jgi:hypothetical protein
MTLLRRAPREVYRVYSEEEYLAAGEDQLASAERWQRSLTISPDDGERRLRRAAAAALLFGTVSVVGGVLVLNSVPPSRGAARRLGADVRTVRGALVAASGHSMRARVSAAHASGTVDVPGRGSAHRGDVARRKASGQASPELPQAHETVQAQGATVEIAQVGAGAPAAPERVARNEFGFER